MSRTAVSALVLLLAAVSTPTVAADPSGEEWVDYAEEVDYCGDSGGGLRGSLASEPKDWSGLGDECDPLTFEVGLRYWYSWGAHGMTVLGDSYSSNDQSQILEGHFRIDDNASDVYVKGIGGYSAVINSSYSTPGVAAGSSQSGRIMYAGADIGYAPLGDGDTKFGGFIGYQYWNDSPDMGRVNFGTGSLPNDLTYHMFKLGLAGRLDLGGVVDVTAEVAAIPYAPLWGTYGAFDAPGAYGVQTSAGTVSGWLWGASGELMARVKPLENWTVGIGGRAWYLNGQADVTFSAGGTNWITKTQSFSTLRYGLLGEVTYNF